MTIPKEYVPVNKISKNRKRKIPAWVTLDTCKQNTEIYTEENKMRINRGSLVISLEQLGLVLGLKYDSIKRININDKHIFIVHNDIDKGAMPHLTGCTIQNTRERIIMNNCPECGERLSAIKELGGGLKCKNGHTFKVQTILIPQEKPKEDNKQPNPQLDLDFKDAGYIRGDLEE